jgi:hypothetical protein
MCVHNQEDQHPGMSMYVALRVRDIRTFKNMYMYEVHVQGDDYVR